MITNEIFQDFLMNLDENSHIWREIFELKKKLFEKNSQCYGVDLTQSDSLKSVKKMPTVQSCFEYHNVPSCLMAFGIPQAPLHFT